MVTTCAHGFDAHDCLICATLDSRAPAGRRRPAAPVVTAEVVGRPRRIGLRVGAGLALAGGAVAVVAVTVFLVAGIVFTILRLAELAVVAAAVGWAAYRVGYHRGRRSATPRGRDHAGRRID
ncbi:MAG: hypothetical protein ACRDY0_09225 [Acidimicrobiales bacterium]